MVSDLLAKRAVVKSREKGAMKLPITLSKLFVVQPPKPGRAIGTAQPEFGGRIYIRL